jgi:beta-glucosidase
MDMNWIDKYRVDAVLLAWLPGMEGGNAMADILTGDVNPSGKLTDTFALDYWDYPSSYNFGSFVDGYETVEADGSEIEWWGMNPVYKSHPSGTEYTRPINNHYFVKYAEGIYVGYRYFETFGIIVRYPFGYGLSYTTFEISIDPIVVRDNKIFITTKVKTCEITDLICQDKFNSTWRRLYSYYKL